jgi:hypothetical protein
MMTTRSARLSLILCGLLAVAAPAAAQVSLTPFIGKTFGGDAEEQRFVYGGTVSFGDKVGFDIDFGFAPNFFGDEDPFFEFESKLNITTLMGNIRIGGNPGRSGASPYVSGGAGLLRASISTTGDLFDDVTRNDFGLNVGAGVQAFFNGRVGLRAEVRYFRSLEDEGGDGSLIDPREFDLGDFTFWRASGGVTFRF